MLCQKIIAFFVHRDRENLLETTNFDACMETHIAHTVRMTDNMHMETYTYKGKIVKLPWLPLLFTFHIPLTAIQFIGNCSMCLDL